MKRLLLAATIGCGLATIAKVLQLALTPEAWAVLSSTGRALLESDAVGFLFVTTAILFLLSLCVAAWERAERRWKADLKTTVRADLAANGFAVVPDDVDTSSLLDDSPQGPLPDDWCAPCGEVVHMHPTTDRGPRAA